MVTKGKSFYPLLLGRVHLASKCHLLEVVSTVNNTKDVGHLQREVCFLLWSVLDCVGGCRTTAHLNGARFGNFFFEALKEIHLMFTARQLNLQGLFSIKKREKIGNRFMAECYWSQALLPVQWLICMCILARWASCCHAGEGAQCSNWMISSCQQNFDIYDLGIWEESWPETASLLLSPSWVSAAWHGRAYRLFFSGTWR